MFGSSRARVVYGIIISGDFGGWTECKYFHQLRSIGRLADDSAQRKATGENSVRPGEQPNVSMVDDANDYLRPIDERIDHNVSTTDPRREGVRKQ